MKFTEGQRVRILRPPHDVAEAENASDAHDPTNLTGTIGVVRDVDTHDTDDDSQPYYVVVDIRDYPEVAGWHEALWYDEDALVDAVTYEREEAEAIASIKAAMKR